MSFCCVSSLWKAVLCRIPQLWNHVVRPSRQPDTSQAARRIERTNQEPLDLSFRISDGDDHIPPFLPLLEQFAHRWQSIEIIGKEFAHVQMVLEFTTHCRLGSLRRLVIHNQSITSHHPPIQQPFLIDAPFLLQIYVSSFVFIHLCPSKTLVDVTLLPCFITINVLRILSVGRIETLKFGLCFWDRLSPVYTVEFPRLLRFTIDGISWTTLEDILQILVAPRLVALDITLQLDRHTHMIDLEEALSLSHRMPCIADLSINCVRIDGCLAYVNALIFLFGWKFLSVTHFTTNLPTYFLSGLWTSTLMMDQEYPDHGFYLTHEVDVPLSIPAIAFPNLVHLKTSSAVGQDLHHRSLRRITIARKTEGVPLTDITCYLEYLSSNDRNVLQPLLRLHDWTGDEVEF